MIALPWILLGGVVLWLIAAGFYNAGYARGFDDAQRIWKGTCEELQRVHRETNAKVEAMFREAR